MLEILGNMFREAYSNLVEWKDRASRKPIVLRGARQVGKTHLVRQLGKQCFDHFIEFNFDQFPGRVNLFQSSDIREILELIELEVGRPVIPGETLLFLDEIQAAPELLPKLRYFYEQFPELHVIAAGSLLEFVLSKHSFSMPVGRIEYMQLGPMTFEEFLMAVDPAGEKLNQRMMEFTLERGIPEPVHNKLDRRYLEYLLTGGLPEVVANYADGKSWLEVTRIQDSLLETYQDDFAKYRGRVDYLRLRKVFQAIPGLVGKKLKYSSIDREETSRELKRCVELLELARVITRVRHSSGNSVPLGAEVKDSDYKPLFLDVGLVSRLLGLSADKLLAGSGSLPPALGLLAEQFVGQHLLYSGPLHLLPELYYWRRQAKSSNAEVDFLYAKDDQVVPVEVKSGSTGTLRSLHQFIRSKETTMAVRFNRDPASRHPLREHSDSCQLLSLPFYLVGQMERLLSQ